MLEGARVVGYAEVLAVILRTSTSVKVRSWVWVCTETPVNVVDLPGRDLVS